MNNLNTLTLEALKLLMLENRLNKGEQVEGPKDLKYPKVEIPVINADGTTVIRDHSIWNGTLKDVLALYDARNEISRSTEGGRLSFDKLGYELLKAKKAMPHANFKLAGKWHFLGNRYLKTSIDKDIGHTSVWVSKGSLEQTINLFSNRLFGKGGKLLNGNFTKFANYINAGTMRRFGINKMDVTYMKFNPVWDGISIVSMDYLHEVHPMLADHFDRTNASIFKMVSFGHLNGHIVPIKGTVIVLRSRNELRFIDSNLDVNSIYSAAKDGFVSSENEIKLMPDGVKLGTRFQAVFGVHNIDTDEGLNRPFVTLHSQLLQRTEFNDPERIYNIIRRNVEFYLDLIKSKNGFYSVLSPDNLDMDSLSTFEVDLGRLLPISSDRRLKESSLTMLERGLNKLVELKVPGISVFPIPSSTLKGYNIAMSPAQAKIISKIIRTDIVTGSVLNIKRDPNVGTGYFPVTVEVRPGLNAMRGILISSDVASLLGADYDGDRISVTGEVFGGVKPAHKVPTTIKNNKGRIASADKLITHMNLTSTGDPDIDNLVAATTGRRIGIADSLATNLMFLGYKNASLFFANHVEQAIINSVKHIKDGIIDIFSTYANVCYFLGFNPKTVGSPQLYKLFTGKLTWEDMLAYNPVTDVTVTSGSVVFKAVKDAVAKVGLNPWILSYNEKAENAKWEAIKHSAKYAVCKIDPNTYGLKLPVRRTPAGTFVNYFKKYVREATPILDQVFGILEQYKVGVATKEDIDSSRNSARDILKNHLAAYRYELHAYNKSALDDSDKLIIPADVTYYHYVAILISRIIATDALYPNVLLAFTRREIVGALAYLRAVYALEQKHNKLLGELKAQLSEARKAGNRKLARILAKKVEKGNDIVNIMKNRPSKNGLDFSVFADQFLNLLVRE